MNLREPTPLPFDVVAYSNELVFQWDREWHPSTGVPHVDFNLDLRNVVVATTPVTAAISIKPAYQFALTRTDRPEAGVVISGSAATPNDYTHYQASFSGAGGKFYFRRGLAYQLTAGTFARAQGILYTAWRSLGVMLTAEEIAFQPTNNTAAASYFPLAGGRAIATSGVSRVKLAVHGMGNLNSDLEWCVAGRLFNDPIARGAWVELENWRTTAAGPIDVNTGEVSFGATLTDYQWLDLALAVRKGADNDPNSRCLFRVIPALKYL